MKKKLHSRVLRMYFPPFIKYAVMTKLTVLLTCAFTIKVFGINSKAQEKISINTDNTNLKNVLQSIEKQTKVKFIYFDETVENKTLTTLSVHDQAWNKVLGPLLEQFNLSLENVSNNNYVIKSSANFVQKTEISGKVVDEKGNPLRGVTVTQKNSKNGVITDVNGEFAIKVDQPLAEIILVFSNMGFVSKEVQAKNAFMHIVLHENLASLDEVVVVGFGTQKKENLTGSVSTLDLSEVKNRVQPNLLSAIQGTTAGVTVISRTGSEPSINIRGRGNLGASSPLYVIDGAISTASVFSNLDPNNIKSVSFLKDAAASSIYGSRAAYGVILVTTKTGIEGKTAIDYNGYVGSRSATYLPKLVSSAQYAELLNEGRYNVNPAAGWNQAFTAEEIEKFKNGSEPDLYPNTDWVDLVLDKHALATNHSLNLSGGSEKVTYFTGLGYNYDNSFTRGSSGKRYNLQMNVNSNLTKWLTFKGNIQYIRNEGKVENGLPSLMNLLLVPPTMVSKHSNGEWGSIAGGKTATQSFINGNPLRAYSRPDWSNSLTENSNYNFGIDIKPIEGLKISAQGILSRYEYKGKSYNGLLPNVTNFITGAEISGTGVYTNAMTMDWRSNQRLQYLTTAEYTKSINEHDFKVLVGTSFENYKYQMLGASRKNFPIDGLEDMSGGSTAAADISNRSEMNNNKLFSYFGRVNYIYANKYLFEANMRADASSNFHKNNRWGYFPSFSAGWKINEEEFLQDVAWLQNLKIRGSWGQLGNINNVGFYDYFQTYSILPAYNFDNTAVTGTRESKPANPNLTWETVTMTDIGIDANFFNGKLGLVADYYIKETKDILLAYNTPLEIGLSANPSQNIGTVRNNGFELTLTHTNKIGEVRYDVGVNMTTNKNRITNLGESDNMITNGGDKVRYINKVGEAIGSYYGYVTNGLYSQEEIDAGHYYKFGRVPKAGDIKYIPQREGVEYGDEITGDDRRIIGVDVPTFTYGINFNIDYKHFFLSAFGQGIRGTKVGFESEQAWAFFLNAAPREYHLGRWSPSNQDVNAIYPRIYGGTSLDDYNQNFSDRQLFSADYFRVKTITFGYELPSDFASRIKLNRARIFLTGENLFTIRGDKKMRDFDPESPTGRGLGSLGIKSIAIGVNVNL